MGDFNVNTLMYIFSTYYYHKLTNLPTRKHLKI